LAQEKPRASEERPPVSRSSMIARTINPIKNEPVQNCSPFVSSDWTSGGFGQSNLLFLFSRLPVTPDLENAFPDPEKTEAIEEEAQNTEIPQEYRVANRQSNADQDYACNDAFHRFLKSTAGLTSMFYAREWINPVTGGL
jgi:hypothetical protein